MGCRRCADRGYVYVVTMDTKDTNVIALIPLSVAERFLKYIEKDYLHPDIAPVVRVVEDAARVRREVNAVLLKCDAG